MDFIEFTMTQMPEAFFNQIENLIKCQLKLLYHKKDTIKTKINEILQLTIETLTANVLLPNLIGILEEIASETT